jgi:fructokinase
MSPHILGLGEVLWDVLPSGAQMGGAPANFAYHAGALGASAGVITRIGQDKLGRDILERFAAMGLPADLVQEDEAAPTGTVTVRLDAQGVPQFTIHEDVAWDRLEATPEGLAAAARADAVCFGSLGQRNEAARESLQRLVAATRPEALRVLDVNLRQAFYTREVIEQSLEQANVLKLNDGELPVLAAMFGLTGMIREQLAALARRFALRVVALTRGPKGSLLLGPDGWSDHPGLPVEVKDTVGAGDAFTAALVLGLLRRIPLDELNAAANAVACHVCGCVGATPALPRHLSKPFAARGGQRG